MLGFQAMALSSRWKTNQFSTQPAISELAKSSTPVKAAYSAVGPSSVSECSTYSADSVPTSGSPRSHQARPCAASTSGAHSARLPKMPAACERIRCTTSSTKDSTDSSLVRSPRRCAMAGAVIAGCLVATVQCSSMISTKLAA